jgi:hypothetical protein
VNRREIIDAAHALRDSLHDDAADAARSIERAENAVRLLVRQGPGEALDTLHEIDPDALEALMLVALQALAERGYGLHGGSGRRGHA